MSERRRVVDVLFKKKKPAPEPQVVVVPEPASKKPEPEPQVVAAPEPAPKPAPEPKSQAVVVPEPAPKKPEPEPQEVVAPEPAPAPESEPEPEPVVVTVVDVSESERELKWYPTRIGRVVFTIPYWEWRYKGSVLQRSLSSRELQDRSLWSTEGLKLKYPILYKRDEEGYRPMALEEYEEMFYGDASS